MPINQYFNYQPLQREDYSFKAPLELMGKTLSYLQDKSDKNYAALDQIPSLLNVPVLEEDAQNRANIENKYRERIKQLVDKTGGDYSGVQKDVLSLQNDLRKDLSFSGNLGAMKANYDAYGAYDKRLKENKTLKDYERYAATKTARANFGKVGGTGIVDPTTGKYNYFSGIDIDGFDRAKFLNDIKEIKPISDEDVTTYMKDNYIIDRTRAWKEVSKERAYTIAKMDLRSNENYQQYARQMATIGIPLSAQDEENALQAFALERSFREDKDDLKRTWNHNLDYQEQKRHNRKMEENTAPQLPPIPTTLNLPMQQGMGIDLNKTITLEGKSVAIDRPTDGSFIPNMGNAGIATRWESGNKIMDFNHPFVKESKTGIEGQAMNMAGRQLWQQYLKTGKDIAPNVANKSWDSFDEKGKNGILTAMSKDVQYKSTLQSAINNNYNSLAGLYNNSTFKAIAYPSEDHRKIISNRIEQMGASLATYNADGSKADMTVSQQIANMTKGMDKPKIQVLANGTSTAPGTEGMSFTEIIVTGEKGEPKKKTVFVDDNSARRGQWQTDLDAWNPSTKQFRYGTGTDKYGQPKSIAWQKSESGIAYDVNGQIGSNYSIAKSTNDDTLSSMGIEGVLFANNTQLYEAAESMPMGQKPSLGGSKVVLGVKQVGPSKYVIVQDGKDQKIYKLEAKESQVEETTYNTDAMQNLPQIGKKGFTDQ